MTTLIKHYVRKTTKATNTEHWDAIFDDGALKTETQVHNIADGVDSDLLWFTTADTVAGGASNYLLQLVRTFMSVRVEEADNMREMFNAHLAKQDADKEEYLCFVFDADEIAAERWNSHKQKWRGASTVRGLYIKRIDASSNCNGDDTRDYWITEHEVDITKAKDFYIVSDSRKQCLLRFGFADYYDFYVWLINLTDKAFAMGASAGSNEYYAFIGKHILKRENYERSLAAA
jgi:hypothetical protein